MTTSAANLVTRLESIVGSECVSASPSDCSNYAVDEIAPATVVRPANVAEICEVVRFAIAEKLSIIPCGARTKLSLGMPPSRYDIALDVTRLNQIAHYDAGDLTVSVDAGMPLRALMDTLAQKRQMLPLMVPYTFQATIGGAVASGLDSPLRHAFGTARDFLLGAEFVDGKGTLCKSGGRVVKNVTGYDLHKLLVGSLGTLAVIARLNFRTFPATLSGSRGFVASFSTLADALRFRSAVAASNLSPLTFDLINPVTSSLFLQKPPVCSELPSDSPEPWIQPANWHMLVAAGGEPSVIARYERELTRFATNADAIRTAFLDDSSRPAVWGRLREAIPLFREQSPLATIVKLSLVPGRHAELIPALESLASNERIALALVARASGGLYIGLLPSKNDVVDEFVARLGRAVSQIFDLSSKLDSHSTVLFAPTQLKRETNAWGPSRPDLSLMRRVKNAFDPQGVFAPGRFVGGL